MPVSEEYRRQVALLVRTLPLVAQDARRASPVPDKHFGVQLLHGHTYLS